MTAVNWLSKRWQQSVLLGPISSRHVPDLPFINSDYFNNLKGLLMQENDDYGFDSIYFTKWD